MNPEQYNCETIDHVDAHLIGLYGHLHRIKGFFFATDLLQDQVDYF